VNKKIDYEKIAPLEYIKSLESKEEGKIIEPSILTPIIKQVLAENPSIVADYKAGKTGVLGFFVGAVMKLTSGKADPGIVNTLLRDTLI
jgi:aspartyl-tRNA(Asn)/glutamyl-tRNA(Gln) amidotransferase subunit B